MEYLTETDAEGRPLKPLLPIYLNVPPVVTLDQSDLVWDIPLEETGYDIEIKGKRVRESVFRWEHREPTAETLQGFINLDSDESILAYARKWGVLGLCEHRLPFGHNWGPSLPLYSKKHRAPYETENERYTRGRGPCGTGYSHASGVNGREPLEVWRHFAKQALALLIIAEDLNAGELTLEDKVQGSDLEWHLATMGMPKAMALSINRFLVSNVVNEWLALGAVRPFLVWEMTNEALNLVKRHNKGVAPNRVREFARPRPAIALATQNPCNLFTVLATQLMFRIGGPNRMGHCAACKQWFEPEAGNRGPKRNQRNFCPECRLKGEPQRHAREDYVRRNASKSHRRKTAVSARNNKRTIARKKGKRN